MDRVDQIEAQAREWSVTLSSGDVDKHVLEKFKHWREADPAHEQAFQEVDRVWQGMASLEHLRRFAVLPEPEPSFWQKCLQGFQGFMESLMQPQGMAAGAAFAMVLAIGIYMVPGSEAPEQVTSTRYASLHGEVKDITLDDGSVLTLKPESKIVVSYSKSLRKVRLDQGGVLFSVARNPQRPFVVMTGATETRVLGTVFSVEHKPKGVDVSVKEGKVRVGKPESSSSSAKHAVLTQGQGVNATLKGDVGLVNKVDPSTVGAWKDGRLAYENATLKEIVEDANRYYDGLILLADKTTAQTRISISFKTDNIEQMIDNLAEVLPLDINRDVPGRVVLRLDE